MRGAASVGVLAFLSAAAVFAGAAAAASGVPDQTAAARAAYVACDEGWRTGNAQEILNSYAPDFEWTNSVGLHFTDKAKLAKFLARLFKEADYAAGKPGPLEITSIRLLGDDVAVVESSESTFGQKDYRTGKPVPEQRTNELTVLQRIGRRWLIISDISSDESHGI